MGGRGTTTAGVFAAAAARRSSTNLATSALGGALRGSAEPAPGPQLPQPQHARQQQQQQQQQATPPAPSRPPRPQPPTHARRVSPVWAEQQGRRKSALLAAGWRGVESGTSEESGTERSTDSEEDGARAGSSGGEKERLGRSGTITQQLQDARPPARHRDTDAARSPRSPVKAAPLPQPAPPSAASTTSAAVARGSGEATDGRAGSRSPTAPARQVPMGTDGRPAWARSQTAQGRVQTRGRRLMDGGATPTPDLRHVRRGPRSGAGGEQRRRLGQRGREHVQAEAGQCQCWPARPWPPAPGQGGPQERDEEAHRDGARLPRLACGARGAGRPGLPQLGVCVGLGSGQRHRLVGRDAAGGAPARALRVPHPLRVPVRAPDPSIRRRHLLRLAPRPPLRARRARAARPAPRSGAHQQPAAERERPVLPRQLRPQQPGPHARGRLPPRLDRAGHPRPAPRSARRSSTSARPRLSCSRAGGGRSSMSGGTSCPRALCARRGRRRRACPATASRAPTFPLPPPAPAALARRRSPTPAPGRQCPPRASAPPAKAPREPSTRPARTRPSPRPSRPRGARAPPPPPAAAC
ncbi:hypothetical protein CALCODRAFT_330062 [Calocera cornea HHB12733]|uniref:Uncharacterized protein n=1 Tax=Calocera cornea HHB12733 TaxID=1353952 RepID=A0A165F378_9BASI|nr:hypothetical protein CALCODRAFT_330062 [Calocera cornea HHB12733]